MVVLKVSPGGKAKVPSSSKVLACKGADADVGVTGVGNATVLVGGGGADKVQVQFDFRRQVEDVSHRPTLAPPLRHRGMGGTLSVPCI